MIADLPEHIAAGDSWHSWPRTLDVHLKWGVRRRQVEGFIRSGKLTEYRCPDATRRLDPDKLTGLLGPPDVVQGRDRDLSAADRKMRHEQADLASGRIDPTVLMFGRAVDMMGGLHAQLIGQLKLISDPMKVLLDAYQKTIDAQAARIATLEQHADEAQVLRSELADAKQERDLAFRKHEASERRRDETLKLLKDAFPDVVASWLSGDSLSGFAKRAPKDLIEALIESNTLSEQDADLLRRHAGIPKASAQPQTQQPNGAS